MCNSWWWSVTESGCGHLGCRPAGRRGAPPRGSASQLASCRRSPFLVLRLPAVQRIHPYIQSTHGNQTLASCRNKSMHIKMNSLCSMNKMPDSEVKIRKRHKQTLQMSSRKSKRPHHSSMDRTQARHKRCEPDDRASNEEGPTTTEW